MSHQSRPASPSITYQTSYEETAVAVSDSEIKKKKIIKGVGLDFWGERW